MAVTTSKARLRSNWKSAAAFDIVFQEHWERVHGVLYRMVGDRAEAEDLALEVFWRLYQRPRMVRREQNLAGWLYRVASNLGLNALRARKRRQHYEQAAGHLALASAFAPDPAVEAERRAEQERVRQVLLQLRPRAAQLLILRHSGFTYAELAAAVGVSPGSIGSLLARAERAFEEKYREFSATAGRTERGSGRGS